MATTPVMYGIPNCGTIKKARAWFAERDLEYSFHDYKKQGVDEQQLRDWLKQFGWEQLINKRGTTWRKLDEQTRESMNDSSALATMLENASIIKRPIIETDGQTVIGFDADEYQQVFGA